MAKPRWTLAVGVVAMVGILTLDRVDAAQGQAPPDVDRLVAPEDPRVRTEDPVVSALIRRGTDLSPTFRELVEAIQATDGVVYVQRGRCGHYVRACLLFWMTVAGPNRILRVVLEDRKTDGDEMAAMASLAHELRHALEVLREPNIKTGSGMYHFYRQGPSIRKETFETQAAINTGNAVYRELKRPPSQRK